MQKINSNRTKGGHPFFWIISPYALALLTVAILNLVRGINDDNDIEEKYRVDSTNENSNNEDSKVQQRGSARTKDSCPVDITKSVNTSKDIIDITDTPDVAVWNKSVQIKSNDANMVKH